MLSVIVSAGMAGMVYLMLSRKIKRMTSPKQSIFDETDLKKHVKVLESRMERCENKLWGTEYEDKGVLQGPVEVLDADHTISSQKDKARYSKKKKAREKRFHIEEAHQEDLKTKVRPENVEYTALTVTDGKLTLASPSQVSYYRAWEIEGDIFYEFYSDKTAKAINNRSAIIEPFCEKEPTSIPADQASHVETVLYGFLNKDYSVKTKTTIKFV